MANEIERKFFVNGAFTHLANKRFKIAQGYLSSDAERTVRVRIKNDKGYITIKGKSDETGMERFEWEKEISYDEANQLLMICEPGIIEKTRHEIAHNDHIIEVDVFKGQNQGLVLAEIELKSKDENINLPNWLGKEVTGDIRFYNSYLSKHPFATW